MDTVSHRYLLLVDLKDSTRLAPDAADRLFVRLEERLAELNRHLDPAPVLGLTISYGDEVAGLFDTPVHLYDIAQQIRDWLRPEVGIRFVAVRGPIGRYSADIRQVGGEVFKRADGAIRAIKRSRRVCRWLIGSPNVDTTLDSLTEMSNAVLEGMTDYQREVYGLLAGGLSQTEAAARLGKYPQSVSDAVRRGRADLVLEATKASTDCLQRSSQWKTMDSHETMKND
jgi:DNA-binding CsgD family transcriptional regulator